MDLNEIAIFIKVVELGSFIGAARALNMPKSTVSAKISSLEERLGVTLIQRTTRKLHITQVGQSYYQQCQEALAQINEAEKKVTLDQSVPMGVLRVTAPVEFGNTLLPQIIQEFSNKFPLVDLEIILKDQYVDFISERIDLAIRVGALEDSSLIAKKLGNIYFAPFAAAKYLKMNPPLKTPKDLEKHRTIIFSTVGDKWAIRSGNNFQNIKVNKGIEINDLNLIKSLALLGQGVALLPTFFCLPEIRNRKLIRVLNKWRTEERPVHIVYPSQKFISPKMRAFIDVAADIIKKSLETAEV